MKVSLLIPARNEESVIERCVKSCINQDYDNLEIIILNDQSEDRTGDLLYELQATTKKLHVLEGAGPREGWLGKPWACQRLADKATGEILMFIDADVWLEPDAVRSVVHSFKETQSDAITVWPQQHLGSQKERIVLPLVYFTLMTMLPAIYVRRDPKWMPSFIRPYFRTAFAAACGQCLAFTRSAYNSIGGHACVREEIVEDVELAKALKRNGRTISMHLGIHKIHCRMYTRDEDILEGFRKNFFAGFGRNVLFFLAAALLHMIVFILPYLLVIIGLIIGELFVVLLSFFAIVLIHLQRVLVDKRNKWNPWYGLLHIRGVLWFQRLGLTVLADHFTRRTVLWKGRPIQGK
ncbi:MAG: glycosyltransferase [Bacteroidetes bacterium]|nr:glycosyltransferase [Bacteroidota bacterium]MCH8522939.1 glycosyltransferase [Balneolales bacterium]